MRELQALRQRVNEMEEGIGAAAKALIDSWKKEYNLQAVVEAGKLLILAHQKLRVHQLHKVKCEDCSADEWCEDMNAYHNGIHINQMAYDKALEALEEERDEQSAE
jgi:predicted nuclease with TOPRIM domain